MLTRLLREEQQNAYFQTNESVTDDHKGAIIITLSSAEKLKTDDMEEIGNYCNNNFSKVTSALPCICTEFSDFNSVSK